ncbi:colicin immunity domain-containing protein [Caballeronia sp. LZ034LL]|uniref:colicin immunity domain-containing protein n=1 Tax=Caballeronia sp. LZ034LL TaxID=3038567 RepID=UPI002862C1E4|nr:colicin immunity domain-containing protein [Caballeronia sp. LZ034LL]MDR5834404.1 colicin immunity domain-containing protein [Caballeronia sp. LZ034LL]
MNALVNRFVAGDIRTSDFEKEYIVAWRACRDNGQLQEAAPNDQQYFDAVFCAIDNYCADPDLRDEGEFDDQMLLTEIIELKSQWESAKSG